jgi:carbonic anhydrase/acetyltransferase-like protein (isoleucine patch superfamily)
MRDIALDVHLEAGVSVWFGCVVRSEAATVTIGRDSNLQDLTVVHTDEDSPTTIGERVTVGHRALLHGCTVEDDALIGMGASPGVSNVLAARAAAELDDHIGPLPLDQGSCRGER